MVGASRYVRRVPRPAMHCTGRAAPRSVLSILHPPPSAAQEQRESGQEGVDGRVLQQVVGHLEQEVVEEVRQVGAMGKCEAEERNCCRCECCW